MSFKSWLNNFKSFKKLDNIEPYCPRDMESLTWITPLWKMKISDTQYEELKKELIYAFETNNAFKKRKLSKEAALFCAEWWRREYNGRQPSKIRVLDDLGLHQSHLREFFKYAEKGLKELRISPVRIKMDYKFRTLLMQGGLPIGHIKNSGDALSNYQRFMVGLIRYVKNISINWNNYSFIKTLDCYNYLPKTFRDDGIFELSLLIANAIITNNDEILPYDVTDDYWNEFTQELKRNARSVSYKVPFVVKWKAVKEKGNIQLFYTLECARKVSESFIHDNNIPDCFSFSIYINNRIAASYRLDTDNVFNSASSNIIFERWNEEPVLSTHIKTDTNAITEITIPNCTAPDLDSPLLFVQADTEEKIWDLKTSTVGSTKSTVLYTNSWIIESEPKTFEKVKLGDLELNWSSFSEKIELKNSHTGESYTFDQNESPYFHEFLNWNLDWVQDANYKILISDPQVRVYGEGQEKLAASRYKICFRKYRDTTWYGLGQQSLPIGLIEFKIIYPDKKFGIEKFYYIGPLKIDYSEMGDVSGSIRINWNGGSIYPLLDQSGLSLNEKGKCFWEVRRDNNSELVYSEKIGFRLQPNSNSPELDLFIATPFKGISIIGLKGENIHSNRIISSSSLFAFIYVIMGHDSVPFKVYHKENPNVVIRGQLKQGINSLSRFDDDIRKLYDLYGAETFDENSNVRIVLGSGSHSKSVEVRDFNLYAKKEGEFEAIRIVNNRNEMQSVDFSGKLFAVSVNCYHEDIQVVELINENEHFIFNADEKLDKFIVFTDKFNNNRAVDLIVPRYFDFTSNGKDIEAAVSGLSPQEANILELLVLLEKSGPLDDEWKKVHKYFIIAVNYNLPFKTFNHFRAIARTPGLLAKLFISLSQSNEVKNAIPLDYIQNALVLFEQEFAVAWHWLNTKNHWEKAIDWLLSGLPSFLHGSTLISLYRQINELLDHSLFNYRKDLVNRLLSEDCETMAIPPTISQVNEIRSKLGANQNYPESEIFIHDEWAFLFRNAANSSFPQFIRSFLFSPVKAALAFMGKDLSIWEPENLLTRRVINFYRQLKPNEYLELFENMVCQLKKK